MTAKSCSCRLNKTFLRSDHQRSSSGANLDLGIAPFRAAAAARRVIFVGGGGVTKMSAASTKNLLCQKAANSKFNPRLKVNLMQRQAMQRSSSYDQQT
jgi:hypothetical protein